MPLAIYIASGIDTHACMKAMRNTPGYGWCVLGRLIIGEFHMHAYSYPYNTIIGGLNIDDFIQKLPVVKIHSLPIFRLIWFHKCHIYWLNATP